MLLPLRDEAPGSTPCLRALLAQRGVPGLRDRRPRRRVHRRHRRRGPRGGRRRPPGPAAHRRRRRRRAGSASRTPARSSPTRPTRTPTALVFVDADVVLAPHAVAAAVDRAARRRRDLLSPYPRIVAGDGGRAAGAAAAAVVWLTFLPLRAMERSPRPSLAAAGGQFLVVDRAGYTAGRRARGGRATRCWRTSSWPGRSSGPAAGSPWPTAPRLADLPDVRRRGRELRDGYTKSLWASFGSPAGGGRRGGAAAAALRRCRRCRAGGCCAGAPGWRCRRWPATCSGWPGGWSPPGRPAGGVAGRAGTPGVGRGPRLADRCGRTICASGAA